MYDPYVAIVSLESDILLDIVRKSEEDYTNTDRVDGSVLLEAGSLLVWNDEMYTSYLHGIAARDHDVLENILNWEQASSSASLGDTVLRSRRTSITIRRVPKTVKAVKLFGRR